MKLSKNSIEWAIKHLNVESDTDLFPCPIEIGIINEKRDDIVKRLIDVDLGNYRWKPSRRFVVPKDELSYRVITQLDPLDSIILSGIIKEFGHLIEARRIPESENVVFGSRFQPNSGGYLYKSDGQWRKFWEYAKEKSQSYECILKFDISDFYNQIYHHTIENQLIESGLPNQVIKSIINLLNSITQRVSRGIPVGPHSTHLLAELSLIPIDNSLRIRSIEYCRYNDDFIAFCNSFEEARIILNTVAEILDKQQRLIIQRQKTKIFNQPQFHYYCNNHLNIEPVNDIEEEIMKIVKEHSDGPYTDKIKYEDLDQEEKDFFSRIYFDEIIKNYLKEDDGPNYPRIRWIYRRLTQLGIPQAIDYSLENIDRLFPVINDVCLYFSSAAKRYTKNWKRNGSIIVNKLNSNLFTSSEYFQITLLNLFIYNTSLNHFDSFARIFELSSENMKRKIILIAWAIGASDWIREIKENYPRFDVWNKRAVLIAASKLPNEERRFFYKGIITNLSSEDILEHIIIKWGKDQ